MGSRAAVDCDTGYTVVGDKYILCGLDGTWSKFTKCAAIGENTLNPFMPNVFCHHYRMDESISNFRVVGWYFHFYSYFK